MQHNNTNNNIKTNTRINGTHIKINNMTHTAHTINTHHNINMNINNNTMNTEYS